MYPDKKSQSEDSNRVKIVSQLYTAESKSSSGVSKLKRNKRFFRHQVEPETTMATEACGLNPSTTRLTYFRWSHSCGNGFKKLISTQQVTWQRDRFHFLRIFTTVESCP